jgi:hypothetical protein
MDPQFESSNAEAERQVRFRFLLVYLGVGPVGLVGGDIIVNVPRGHSLALGPVALGVFPAIELTLALGLAYLAARAIVMLSVPSSISIRDGVIVGDFRRPGWLGAPIKEIRLADVRLIRRARLLRVPIVFGRKNPNRQSAVYESPFFYVSKTNAEIIRHALDRIAERAAHDMPADPREERLDSTCV